MEYQLNPWKALDAVIAKKWMIMATAVISLFFGLLIADLGTPDLYTTSATIYSASYASYRESVEGINAMISYADIVQSRKVAQRAAARMSQPVSAEEVMQMVSLSYIENSAVLTLYATSPDPDLAVDVANAVAEAFVREVENITAVESVQVLDPALTAHLSSRGIVTVMKVCTALTAFCVFLVCALIAALALLDPRVAFPREVTLNGELELLGAIPDRNI